MNGAANQTFVNEVGHEESKEHHQHPTSISAGTIIAPTNQSSLFISRGLKVFLMTTNDRYQQYYMEHEGSLVYFYKSRREDKGTIVHDLQMAHIVSIDSPDRKVLCKSKRHFGVTLVTQ